MFLIDPTHEDATIDKSWTSAVGAREDLDSGHNDNRCSRSRGCTLKDVNTGNNKLQGVEMMLAGG